MKEITGLNTIIKNLGGVPIKLDETNDAKVLDILLQFVGQFHGGAARRDLKMVKLANVLVNYKDDSIVVEDSELEMLQEAVEQNRPGFAALLRAPVYEVLQSAKDAKRPTPTDVIPMPTAAV